MDQSRRPRLTRSHDRKIAGVAGGFAEYFDVDPTVMRLLFVIAAFVSGFGAIAYLVLWIVMPPPPTGAEPVAPERRAAAEAAGVPPTDGEETSSGDRGGMLLGVVLASLGALLLLQMLGGASTFAGRDLSWFGAGLMHLVWPLLLLGAGIWLVTRRSGARD